MSESSAGSRSESRSNGGSDSNGSSTTLLHRLLEIFRPRNGDSSLREAIEEIIEESEREHEGEDSTPIRDDERSMLANILSLRHLTADDVSVPRPDIVAVDVDTDLDELIAVMRQASHSRLPVYRGNLDDVLGMVHVKDVLAHARGGASISDFMRDILFVAPSMPVLDILLKMRQERTHMALVVDEFGGVDGLITIEDVVEEIVGEIEDEHDVAERPKLVARPDGTIIADARAPIEDFEAMVGPVLTDEEREEDLDTLGGLIAELAGRVPNRGELIRHASGLSFEVLDADPRSVKRLRIRDLPRTDDSPPPAEE